MIDDPILYCIKDAADIVVKVANLAVEIRKVEELNSLQQKIGDLPLVTKAVLDYTKLIREDVASLMHMYFKSAIENLSYALTSDEKSCYEYIKHAKYKFIEACSLEHNENLILSYLGLSLCQSILGESSNAVLSLNKINPVSYQPVILPDTLTLEFSSSKIYLLSRYYVKIIGIESRSCNDRERQYRNLINENAYILALYNGGWVSDVINVTHRRSFDESTADMILRKGLQILYEYEFNEYKNQITKVLGL